MGEKSEKPQKQGAKRPRTLNATEYKEKIARSSSNRPNKKVNKPTLVEISAIKYARGSMSHSTKNMKFKGLRKTMEETTENIKNASMKTAGKTFGYESYLSTGSAYTC